MDNLQPPMKLDYDFASKRFQILEIIVIAIMPFLQGAASRLPFIYYVIHLKDQFELDWLPIGLSIGAYQGFRVLTSALAIYSPKVAHLTGTLVGLAGFIIVYASDNDSLPPFIAGSVIIGMSEIVSCIQQYAKEIYKNHPDLEKTPLRIKYQYVIATVGVMFAFLLGGFAYQYYDISGVAIVGIVIQSLSLISYFLFLWLIEKTEVNDVYLSTASHLSETNEIHLESDHNHSEINHHILNQALESTDMTTILENKFEENGDKESKEDYKINKSILDYNSPRTVNDVIVNDISAKDIKSIEQTKDNELFHTD